MDSLKEALIDFLLELKKWSFFFLTFYIFLVMSNLYALREYNIANVSIQVVYAIFVFIIVTAIYAYLNVTNQYKIYTTDLFVNYDYKYNFLSLNRHFASELQEKIVSQLVYCKECRVLKPPRSHHCKKCNKCSLKYDHHCDVFDICIDFHRYKHFYQFNFYIGILTVYVSIILIISFGRISGVTLFLNTIILFVICVFVSFFSLGFFFFHTFLILNNETTVEFSALNAYIMKDNSHNHVFQEGLITERVNSRNRKILNPYNINFYFNWCEVMGDNWVDWIFPKLFTRGDGTTFTKNYADES